MKNHSKDKVKKKIKFKMQLSVRLWNGCSSHWRSHRRQVTLAVSALRRIKKEKEYRIYLNVNFMFAYVPIATSEHTYIQMYTTV